MPSTSWPYAAQWATLWGLLVAVFGAATALQVSGAAGVLGVHRFETRAEGLFEATAANETLTRWGAIRRVTLRRRYMLVALSWWLFHLIPHRAFADAATAERFHQELCRRSGGKGRRRHPARGVLVALGPLSPASCPWKARMTASQRRALQLDLRFRGGRITIAGLFWAHRRIYVLLPLYFGVAAAFWLAYGPAAAGYVGVAFVMLILRALGFYRVSVAHWPVHQPVLDWARVEELAAADPNPSTRQT